MTTTPYVDENGLHRRTKEKQDDMRIVRGVGDLIIDIKDIFDPTTITQMRVLPRWAAAWGISLQDVDEAALLRVLYDESVVATLMTSREHGELYNIVVNALQSGETPSNLPKYRVRLSGELACALLVTAFDGPFIGDDAVEQYLQAAGERSTRH